MQELKIKKIKIILNEGDVVWLPMRELIIHQSSNEVFLGNWHDQRALNNEKTQKAPTWKIWNNSIEKTVLI